MGAIPALNIKLFADGADKKGMLELYKNPRIKGFTTNPSLLRKAGVTDYKAYALDLLSEISDYPISFEVFADDLSDMRAQALEIATWGSNVYVKIPVMNTKGISTADLIHELAQTGVKQNITAIMLLEQVQEVAAALADGPSAFVSVFAGRIADTGRDPMPIMRAALEILKPYPQLELLWAGTREMFNLFQADEMGCHIITVPNSILASLPLLGKDLFVHSLDAVKAFYHDATAAGLELDVSREAIAEA